MKTPFRVALALLGALIQAVGLCNIHAFASVTEGGVLGATLLIDHWFAISPALSALVLNILCYLFGWRTLGKEFLLYSGISSAAYSLFYALLEPFAPLWPALVESPFWSAIVGAVFIGVGAGLSIRMGGATCGDDALAMALSRLTKIDIQWIYLLTDLTVLLLSASYIPLSTLGWSLMTVVLSGQIIGWVQKIGKPPAERSAA
ncbi:MAG: YitT family protein [Clostridia bacterium]|nr:YitT family protein [Clostridia bacterium]